MKKFLLLLLLFIGNCVFANEEVLLKQKSIQNQIDVCGARILNANQIQEKIIFVYDDEAKNNALKTVDNLNKRQVVLYKNDYKFIDNEDELSAFLARDIAIAQRTYKGIFRGTLRTLQIKAAPKKFEIVADKTAVDYMVTAGYNPLALLTYLQKTTPQRRYMPMGTKNLVSKRQAIIYEYIYTKYPYFLKNNGYLHNPHYQNFLLTSLENRKLLENKINSNSKEELKYE
ncbi:hypothetical protein J6Q66_00980 [bacterium]|nr:hypothetical protein [bacterium]